jgi:hypothetical protein
MERPTSDDYNTYLVNTSKILVELAEEIRGDNSLFSEIARRQTLSLLE